MFPVLTAKPHQGRQLSGLLVSYRSRNVPALTLECQDFCIRMLWVSLPAYKTHSALASGAFRVVSLSRRHFVSF
jgi:hypothetical protein